MIPCKSYLVDGKCTNVGAVLLLTIEHCYQKLAKTLGPPNCNFLSSVLEPLDSFNYKIRIRLDVEIHLKVLSRFKNFWIMLLWCAKQGDIFGASFSVQLLIPKSCRTKHATSVVKVMHKDHESARAVGTLTITLYITIDASVAFYI